MVKRNINLDLIRCVAVLFVVSVHFCLNSGFYEIPCQGMRMLAMCILRTCFMACVPLFLMLTGYLMNCKKLSLEYYRGIRGTYFTYVLVSICCLVFRIAYAHEYMGIAQIVQSIFDFSANSYSWYIEMYIGLFLMIPFLNILWNNINEKKIWLILSLLCVTIIPSLFNCWIIQASTGNDVVYCAIFPDYWEVLYPITYYFIGAYLSYKPPTVHVVKESFLLIGTMILFGLFTYYRSYGEYYEWVSYNGFQGYQPAVIAVMLFRILLAINMDKASEFVKK